MKFEDFLKDEGVRKITPDREKAKSLTKMSVRAIEAAHSQDIPEFKLTTAYTAIRQVLEAIALVEGYAVFSHKAYTYYLREKGEHTQAELFDRYRRLRNGVEYYGEGVPEKTAQEAVERIADACELLKSKYLGGVE